jgi:drug/metabolite transporter (DMT)-like permease
MGPRIGNSSLRGIAFKVASVLIFLVMSSLLKASQGVPAGELVFFRSFFGVFPVVAFLAWRGELRDGLKSNNVVSQIWRGLVGTVSMGLGFFALTKLPLPEAVTINYAMPLIIVIFSAIFLHETVRLYRWSAVIIGLLGVVVIAWPRLTLFSSGVDSGAALGVGAAVCAASLGAVAQLLVRKLIKTERSATIVLYFLLSSSLISLVTVPFGWVLPSPLVAIYLVGAGFAGGIAQILLTESYRHADMSVVAPFEYSSLVFSVIIGFVFFGDVPTWFMLVGGIIVVGSGLFIIYREHRLGIDRSRVREVVTPQG